MRFLPPLFALLLLSPRAHCDALKTQLEVAFARVNTNANACSAKAPESVCTNMAEFSCADGRIWDGTGYESIAPASTNRLEDFSTANSRSLRAASDKFMDEHQNVHQSVARVVGAPICSTPQSPECHRLVKSAVAYVAAKTLFSSTAQDFRKSFWARMRMSPPSGVDGVLMDTPEFYTFLQGQSSGLKKSLIVKGAAPRVHAIFERVRKILKRKVSASVKDADVRSRLIEKVSAIKFLGTECSTFMQTSGSNIPNRDNLSVNSMLIQNAAYLPEENGFYFCNGLLNESSSEFALVFTIGHELTHSIDTCGGTAEFKSASGQMHRVFDYPRSGSTSETDRVFPFAKTLECLRSSESVGAKRGKLVGEAETKVKYCMVDQAGESFSDFMGAEILSDYMKENWSLSSENFRFGVSNAMRSMCHGKDSLKPVSGTEQFDPHPRVVDRINKIIMQQPSLRRAMSCAETPRAVGRHCQL